MIMNPSECRALLDKAVIIASVTPEEHQLLGGIYKHHGPLYREMLVADVSQLPRLGRQRYRKYKINSSGRLMPRDAITLADVREPTPPLSASRADDEGATTSNASSPSTAPT
jgi:hypothetical protein